MHSLYSRHPNGLLKTHTGTRRARPRSVFNVRLFNGNLESFIKVPITSLPAWHCSSSYLFPVLLWLSGHFGGFPQSILALVLSFTNQKNNNIFVLRWILETFLVSQWALAVCVWDVGVALIDLEGCGRKGMAVGGINVCLSQLPWLTADLASLSCSGREIHSSSKARAEASESSRINDSQWADARLIRCAASLLRPFLCLPLVTVSGPALSCPVPTVFFWVWCQHRVEWGCTLSKSFGGQLLWS